jgi:hypothetical protein
VNILSGIVVDGDGAKTAGDIDDAGTVCGAQKRQQRLGEGDGAEEVGFEGAAQGFDADIAGVTIALFGDCGVVDEHVEVSEFGLDVLCELCGAIDGIVEVRRDVTYVEAFCAQLGGSFFSACSVTRSQQYREASATQLAGYLETDALVGSCD